METNKINKPLTKELVLQYVTESQLFEKYLGIAPQRGTFLNPFREDKTPGCGFFRKNGRIYFKDAAKYIRYDCFDVVQQRFNCTFKQALLIIAKDFNINPNEERENIDIKLDKNEDVINSLSFTRASSSFKVETKPFTYFELKFWTPPGLNITQDILQENGIYSVKNLKINNTELFNLKMVFAYVENKSINQIYQPQNKNTGYTKFMNTTSFALGGLSWLKKESYVVITKSKKDSFFLRLLGVNACYIASEALVLDKATMNNLNKHYKKIFTLFDNDWRGRRSSIIYYHLYKTIPLMFPCIYKKDFSDNLFEKGSEEMSKIIDQVKQKYNL